MASAAWNAEMDRVSAATASSATKEILADHTITEAELVSTQDALTSCLAPAGVTSITFDTDGVGYETNTPKGDPQDLVDAMDACEASTGYEEIGLLYYGILDNPEKVDPTPEIVACLAEHGLVPEDYTAEDYTRDIASNTLPFATTSANMQVYAACTSGS